MTAWRGELEELVHRRSTQPVEYMAVETAPLWRDESRVPPQLGEYAAGAQVSPPSAAQRAALSPLQRFALLKLCRAKHDNINFVPAMREFGLLA